MSRRCSFLIAVLTISILPSFFACLCEPVVGQATKSTNNDFRVMTWNIWHGGREDGKEVGPKRVIEIIKKSKADIVAMQETYGSGEIISKGLGYHYQPRGTNLSIHSRFPILEDISVFHPFKCVGSLIELPNKEKLAFYCIWLPYSKDIWLPNSRKGASVEDLQKACRVSKEDLEKIRSLISKRLADKKYQNVPVMIAGDFNSMSHLDYRKVTEDQFGTAIDWETSKVMIENGFRDAYRETNPQIDRKTDSTWSPKFPMQVQDRIDFIYYKAKRLRCTSSKVIRNHKVKFPSDHAAVVAHFRPETPRPNQKLKVMSYNIKRGYGLDDKTDLERTGKAIEKHQPDFVGLQEIDFLTKRSGKKNQMAQLGKSLGMHAAFGKFMNYQGGQYGMGILSRYPIQSVETLKLPKGNEPRVALAVKVKLPCGKEILVVNVHFDWVEDDRFRFQQAKVVRDYLAKQKIPYLLVGDFNDQPNSRTLKMFTNLCTEAKKPKDGRFTFPADKPNIEIDFAFGGPKNNWDVLSTKVIEEKVASDHRPVISEWKLRSQDHQEK